MSDPNEIDTVEHGKQVILAEARTLRLVAERLDDAFCKAIDAVHRCKGHVVVTGMGKAGIVGRKISATLASTGTPSLYLHPADAVHGDLGRITKGDVVLALSNSGESDEMKALLPHVRRIEHVTIVAITGKPESTLARHSDIVVDMGEIAEACPLGLAPTASTTAILAIGDALALCVLKRRNFTKEQYALYHPAGALAYKLMKVSDVMRKGDRNVCVEPDVLVGQVIARMTRVRAGAACVVDADNMLLGIFTDGDLRRQLEAHQNILELAVAEVMTKGPRVKVRHSDLAADGARLLRENQFDEAPVIDKDGRCVGILDIQDLLATGLI